MKFAIALPGSHHIPPQPEWVLNLKAPDYQLFASVVDGLSFHTLRTPEHLAMPLETVPRLGPYWTDALTVMAFVAGATQRIRVDTGVLVLPYHHPVKLAKAVATLDVLSGGRVNLSLGVGHAEREFEILGVPYHERGKYTDESLAAIETCWQSEEPVFHGKYFDIEGVAFQPHPIQQPRPPIMVGGNSDAALRRAARYDGWEPNPTNFTLEELGPRLDFLRSLPDYQSKADVFSLRYVGLGGLKLEPFSSSATHLAGIKDQLTEALGALLPYGITDVSLPAIPTSSFAEHLDSLRWLDEAVLPDFA